jgi:hypothetical protein
MANERVSFLETGRYTKLWVFKLPVECRANRKAWMTSTLFGKWLLKFYKQMRAEKCNIVVILDNCATHSLNTAALRNVSVYFLLPNTKSETQLMDTGVIRNLKIHYCNQLVCQRLAACEGVSFQFNILDLMELLRRTWYIVEPETIINCDKSVGLDTDREMKDKIRWMIRWILQAVTGMHCISIPGGVDFNDHVSIDDNAAVSEVPNDSDIVSAV